MMGDHIVLIYCISETTVKLKSKNMKFFVYESTFTSNLKETILKCTSLNKYMGDSLTDDLCLSINR